MSNTWTNRMARLARAAQDQIARHGLKAAIIAVGAVIAVETASQTTIYVTETPLVQRVAATAPAAKPNPLLPVARTSPVKMLDNGVDHARIDYWISKLTTSLKTDFEKALDRKAKYDDMITAKLDAADMPRDLIYLAMIESEFNPNAKSHAHAVGMWQFMSSTARRFGLSVGRHVDQRKDPARATDAAVKYLGFLHDRFGSWYLAAAAYNSGEGTVRKALKRVTGRTHGTDADFFRILPKLPKETRDYVPKLIAAARVGNDPAKYGLAVDDAPGAKASSASSTHAASSSSTKQNSAQDVHSATW